VACKAHGGTRGWTGAGLARLECGGGGLSKCSSCKVLREELWRSSGAACAVQFGVWMIGPASSIWVSKKLNASICPLIVRGEIRWCQGLTAEPAPARSGGFADQGVDQGDHFIVNAQKILDLLRRQAD